MNQTFYLSIAYYPEQWCEENWAHDFQMIRDAGFHAVRMFEFAWGRMEPRDGVFDFSMMDRAIELAAQHGLKTVLCTPTEAPPPWLWNAHGDILPVSVSGLPYAASGRRHGCPNSETFRRYSERIADQMAAHYAGNAHVVAWQIDNEAGCHVNMRCYCESCQIKFRRWLEEKYQTVERLNEAWGLVFWSGEVNSFQEVALHKNHLTLSNPAYELDISRFQSDSWIDFLAAQGDIIRSHTSTQAVTHNLAWHAEQIDGYKLGKKLDFMGIDSYPPRSDLNNMTAEMYYGMKEKPFAIMEMGAGYAVIETEDGVLLDRESQTSMVVRHMMNGAFLCSLFRYRPAPSGGEMDAPDCGLVFHDGTPTPCWHAFHAHRALLEKLGRELFSQEADASKISDVVCRYPRAYQAAMVLDYDDYLMIHSTPRSRNESRSAYQAHGTDYMSDMLIWHSAMQTLGIECAFVSPDADLSGFRMVVAHEKWTITPSFAEKLKVYVDRGGILIAADRFGTHTPQGKMSCVTLPGYCADLFGITYTEQLSLSRDGLVSIRMADETISAHRQIVPLTLAGARKMGTFCGGDLDGIAAVSCHQYGNGCAWYIGALIEKDGVLSILRAIMDQMQIGYTLYGDGVERIARGPITALLNQTNQTVRINLREGSVDFLSESPIDAITVKPRGFHVVKDLFAD